MKQNYHPDTDSLYSDLSEQPSAESRETTAGSGLTPACRPVNHPR